MSRVGEACEAWSQLCAFLAGIFFTCIILIIQQRNDFPYDVSFFSLHYALPLEVVAVPLALTFIFYVFAAISYADALGGRDERIEMRVRTANAIGRMGFVFTFVSLFVIMWLIDFWIALLEVIVAIVVFVYLIRHR